MRATICIISILLPALAAAQVTGETVAEAAGCPVLDTSRCPAFASILEAGEQAFPVVLEALSSEDRRVRSRAARIAARQELGEPASRAKALIARLTDAAPNARAAILDALGRIDDEQAEAQLLAIARDPKAAANERMIAANGLGTLKPEGAREALTVALDAKEPRLQAAAAQNLGRLGDARAVDALIGRALEEITAGFVRQAAATSLAKLGDQRAVPALGILFALDDDRVRASAARALGVLKASTAVPLLSRHLTDEALARPVAEALSAIGGTRAAIALSQIVAGSQPKPAQMAALWGLGTIGDPRAFPGAVRGLKSEDIEIVRATVEALGRMKAAAAVPHLIELLSHEDAQVQKSAVWALQEITGERHGRDAEAWKAWTPPSP